MHGPAAVAQRERRATSDGYRCSAPTSGRAAASCRGTVALEANALWSSVCAGQPRSLYVMTRDRATITTARKVHAAQHARKHSQAPRARGLAILLPSPPSALSRKPPVPIGDAAHHKRREVAPLLGHALSDAEDTGDDRQEHAEHTLKKVNTAATEIAGSAQTDWPSIRIDCAYCEAATCRRFASNSIV